MKKSKRQRTALLPNGCNSCLSRLHSSRNYCPAHASFPQQVGEPGSGPPASRGYRRAGGGTAPCESSSQAAETCRALQGPDVLPTVRAIAAAAARSWEAVDLISAATLCYLQTCGGYGADF